jgi:hypothetical protein
MAEKITEKEIDEDTLKAKQEFAKRELKLDPKLFIQKEIDLSQADYKIDALQNELLNFYLRADPRFRRAFHTNFTSVFLKFLIDKARMREPVHISVLGQVRGGKSYSMITVLAFNMALYGKKVTIENICANAYEFLEKLQQFPMEFLKNSTFLIDEQKEAVYSVGSVAKKVKIQDVANIIAINNISTIMINPVKWADAGSSQYGLRLFGKCEKTKTCRMMLYNLQEKGSGGELPMGMVYLPIFTEVIPYAEQFEREYLEKKKTWVAEEQRGEGDILFSLKRKTAEKFAKDPTYRQIRHKQERLTYIGLKMGSEWTKGECVEIESLTKLMSQNLMPDEEVKEEEQEEVKETEEGTTDE